MKHIPNALTVLRIVCSPLILLTQTFTLPFYTVYFVCGLSDFLDGKLARRFNVASKAGASLDNIADYLLIACTLIKVLPALQLKKWSLIWGLFMFAAHVSSSIVAFIKYKRIIVLHTVANKMLGGAVYAVPLLAGFIDNTLLVTIICVFLCFSVPEEYYLLLKSKHWEPDVRGVLFDNSNAHKGYADASKISA